MAKLKGVLKNAFGEVMPGHTIVFVSLKNTQTVLNTVISEIVTDADGSYEKNVYQGRYQINIYKDGELQTKVGIIELYADSPDADVNTYLTLPGEEEVTPEFIQQVIELKNQAIQASDASVLAASQVSTDKSDITAMRDQVSAAQVEVNNNAVIAKNSAEAAEAARAEVETNSTTVADLSAQVSEDAAQISADAAQVSVDKSEASASSQSASDAAVRAENAANSINPEEIELNIKQSFSEGSGASLIGVSGGGNLQEELNNLQSNSISEINSVADFPGVDQSQSNKVHLKGWYTNSTLGEGTFYFDSTIAKSNHDGGVYISPTVPYTTPENFIKATGETDASGSGCWVRVVSLPWIHADWYGLNSSVDAGVVMNAVSKRAALMRLEVRVRKGTYLIKTAWNHTWIPDGTGRYPTPNIYGDGGEFTTFITDYASFGDNAYGAIFTGSKQIGQDNFKFYGIGFRTNSPNDVPGQLYRGFCVKFTDFWGLDIDDLRVARAYLGVSFDNVLYFKFSNWRIAGCHIGSRFRRTADLVGTGNGTGLNAGVMENCRWSEIAHQGIVATESHGVKMLACSFENIGNRVDVNGTAITGDACARISDFGGAGGVGWVFDTCYFEANSVRDIIFNYTTSINVTQSVINCIFNKTTGAPPKQPRITVNGGRTAGTYTGAVTLIVRGSSFNDYAVGSTYADIEFTNFSLTTDSYDHAKLYEYENYLSGGVNVSTGVSYRKAGNELANVRVGTNGALTNTNSAKTCTKSGTGVYVITFACSVVNAQVQINLKSAGFATYSQTANTLTVTTVNAAGAAQDISFDLLVTS